MNYIDYRGRRTVLVSLAGLISASISNAAALSGGIPGDKEAKSLSN